MELRQLRFFLAVADAGSFTRGAERLHIAQPALSIAIRKLEEELGVRLFHRRDRKIALTAEGEALAVRAREIARAFAEAEQEIADLRGLLKGEVRVGITPMMRGVFFPKLISSFKRLHPPLQVAVHGYSATEIQRRIASGELDIGVLAGEVPEGFDRLRLLRDELVACVHVGHPFARRKKVPVREILGQPLIRFQAGYHLGERIDELAAAEGVVLSVVAESNLFPLALGLVREELGVAFLPRMAAAQDADVAAVSFDPPQYVDLSIAWKRSASLSRANRAFVDFLVQELDEYYLLLQVAGTFPLP